MDDAGLMIGDLLGERETISKDELHQAGTSRRFMDHVTDLPGGKPSFVRRSRPLTAL